MLTVGFKGAFIEELKISVLAPKIRSISFSSIQASMLL